MKVLSMIALASFLCFGTVAKAQVSVNVNVGSPPAWAPATPAGVEYYYLPDIDSYYDINTTEYIYANNGQWIRSRELPVAYRSYNPARGRTIIVNDYHGRSPYVNYKTYHTKYYKTKVVRRPHKTVIVRKGNPGHGNGHGNGHGKGH